MKFLVTGGAGFIGSHVCERLLEAGHSVIALDNLNSFYNPSIKLQNIRDIEARGGNFQFIHADITDRRSIDEVFKAGSFDQVIHLAARAGIRSSLIEPAAFLRDNVEGTCVILESARCHGVKKITLASSSSVYGINKSVPFAEGDPVYSAISPYASSKIACESLGHVFHHLHGMDVANLRFFTVYGPRQRPDLAIHKFARCIMDNKPISVFGDGSTARDYTYISDIVDGVIACTTRHFGCEIMNLGESQTVTLIRLIKLLEKSLGRKAILEHHALQPGDVPLTFADISKARTTLGYSPRVSIEQGIPLFVDWFRKQSGAQELCPLNLPLRTS